MPLEAAVVVRGPSGRRFVRAEQARQIVPQPTLSRVPNSELCMALVAGRVVSVIELAGSSGALLVCELEGEAVAFSGLVIEQVGLFEIGAAGARVGEALLPELSLSEQLRLTLGNDTETDDFDEPE